MVILSLAWGLSVSACDAPVPREEITARLAGTKPLHIVLIVVDTLRPDMLTPYGASPDVSPELARWASRGIVFENVLAQSSWTKISMASMLTSLWPGSHRIREADDGLAAPALTLAEALSRAGYRSVAVQSNGWLDQSFGFQQGFERYAFPKAGHVPHGMRSSLWPHADRVVDEAVRLIESHPPTRPLFLYVHLMDVHEYASPPEFKRFGRDIQGAYRAAIRFEDDAIERVRRALESHGLAEQSLLVVTSDHGEAFGENLLFGHARNVLTATLRIPLVVRLPFAVDPIRIGTQVRGIDIAPTLLEAAGVSIPPSFEGESLWPLLVKDTGDRESYAALGFKLFEEARVQVSLNDGAWTFVRNLPPDDAVGEQLFDRRVDPGEHVDLIASEVAQAARMREQLDAHLEAREDTAVRAEGLRIDPAIADRLRAMGYME